MPIVPDTLANHCFSLFSFEELGFRLVLGVYKWKPDHLIIQRMVLSKVVTGSLLYKTAQKLKNSLSAIRRGFRRFTRAEINIDRDNCWRIFLGGGGLKGRRRAGAAQCGTDIPPNCAGGALWGYRRVQVVWVT